MTLKWTGERYLPFLDTQVVGAEIHYEHLHRYAFAAQFVRGKQVLDLASGEGYGSYMLAKDAAKVTGVEIDPAAVSHAITTYPKKNLEFKQGSILDIPLDGQNIYDVIICFEALEHIEDHNRLLSEVKRLLKNDGLFIASTPNKKTYTDDTHYNNPYHLKELYFEDFKNLLLRHFQRAYIYGQRVFSGSTIWCSHPINDAKYSEFIIEKSDASFHFIDEGNKTPLYFISIASDAHLDNLINMKSYLIDTSNMITGHRDVQIASLSKQLQQANSQTEALSQQLQQANSQTEALSQEIADMRRSVVWQMLMRFHCGFVEKALPHRTKRRMIYDLGINCGRVLFNDGVRSFFRSFKSMAKNNMPFKVLVRINQCSYKLNKMVYQKDRMQSKAAFVSPQVDILIPVYNHEKYLDDCIKSAINQTYKNVNIVIVDDCSTEPLVAEILEKYKNKKRVNISYNDKNLGISETLNKAILSSSGDFLAFLDCDDLIVPDAIEKAINYIRLNPNKKYLYSNRINIGPDGSILEHISFQNRGANAKDELLNGMYTSHLKIISKDCFLKVGLFRSKYDSAQDYDLALRMSEYFEFGYINEYLYNHRIHDSQVSQKNLEKQEKLAKSIKLDAVQRRMIINGEDDELVSVVMLTFNRLDDTIRSIESIYKYTKFPFELIIFDNASSDPKMKEYLSKLMNTKRNVKVIFSKINLGCAGGRKQAVKYARGDYIVTLDSDISVTPNWLENLVVRIKEDNKIAAACAKVVFPDGKVQYNGGRFEIDKEFIKFSLVDADKERTDLSTLSECDCDWLPGGAQIIKRLFLEKVEYREELAGAYEDNDYSLQIKNIGGRLVNCPLAEVIHYHMQYSNCALNDKTYMVGRYNKDKLMKAFTSFYKYNSLILNDPDLYNMLGLSNKSDEEIKAFIVNCNIN